MWPLPSSIVVFLMLGSAVALAGCMGGGDGADADAGDGPGSGSGAGGSGPASGDGTGSVTYSVKDAPSDYVQVLVTFTEVRVHRAGASGGEDDGNGNTGDGGAALAGEDGNASDAANGRAGNGGGMGRSGWETVWSGEETVDLRAFSAPTARRPLGTSVEAGDYTKVRITVANATGVTADGNETAFKVPSGTLRILENFTVIPGEDLEMVFDFDLEHSIVERGQGDRDPVFKPVLKRIVSSAADSDADGTHDVADADDDNDGIPDSEDADADGSDVEDADEVEVEGGPEDGA